MIKLIETIPVGIKLQKGEELTTHQAPIKEDDDPYETKKNFPMGKKVTGSMTPDGKEYSGKVVGYSRNSDDIYINYKGKIVKLVGMSVSLD